MRAGDILACGLDQLSSDVNFKESNAWDHGHGGACRGLYMSGEFIADPCPDVEAVELARELLSPLVALA